MVIKPEIFITSSFLIFDNSEKYGTYLKDGMQIPIKKLEMAIDKVKDNVVIDNNISLKEKQSNLDNLKKDNVVNLNVEGKAYHEWAMKIMEFLQKNKFLDVQIKTLK